MQMPAVFKFGKSNIDPPLSAHLFGLGLYCGEKFS